MKTLAKTAVFDLIKSVLLAWSRNRFSLNLTAEVFYYLLVIRRGAQTGKAITVTGSD